MKVFVLLPARTWPSCGTGTCLPSREEPATSEVVRPSLLVQAIAAGYLSRLTSESRLFWRPEPRVASGWSATAT